MAQGSTGVVEEVDCLKPVDYITLAIDESTAVKQLASIMYFF